MPAARPAFWWGMTASTPSPPPSCEYLRVVVAEPEPTAYAARPAATGATADAMAAADPPSGTANQVTLPPASTEMPVRWPWHFEEQPVGAAGDGDGRWLAGAEGDVLAEVDGVGGGEGHRRRALREDGVAERLPVAPPLLEGDGEVVVAGHHGRPHTGHRHGDVRDGAAHDRLVRRRDPGDAEAEPGLLLGEAERDREHGQRLGPEGETGEPPVGRWDQALRQAVRLERFRRLLDDGLGILPQRVGREDRGGGVTSRHRRPGPGRRCRRWLPEVAVQAVTVSSAATARRDGRTQRPGPAWVGRRAAASPGQREESSHHFSPILMRKARRPSVGPASGPSSRSDRVAATGVPAGSARQGSGPGARRCRWSPGSWPVRLVWTDTAWTVPSTVLSSGSRRLDPGALDDPLVVTR